MYMHMYCLPTIRTCTCTCTCLHYERFLSCLPVVFLSSSESFIFFFLNLFQLEPLVFLAPPFCCLLRGNYERSFLCFFSRFCEAGFHSEKLTLSRFLSVFASLSVAERLLLFCSASYRLTPTPNILLQALSVKSSLA